MNNEVKNWQGKVIGFKCFQCGNVYDQMWDTTCNSCRNRNDENSKLRSEISKLTDAINKLNSPTP